MSSETVEYWDRRALDFGRTGSGLRAVASYGMPGFYNASIDLTQWLALRPFIRTARGCSVLDVGCGIGRWSRRFAREGARVIGVDHSRAMVEEARERTASAGLSESVKFLVADVARLRLQDVFDRVVVVTVLQHIVEDEAVENALRNLKDVLAPNGRMLLLEVAPDAVVDHKVAPCFRPRPKGLYVDIARASGLAVEEVRVVDSAPLKQWILPHYSSLPPAAASSLLLSTTAAATLFDLVCGRFLPKLSWHKLLVLRHGP